MTAYRIWPSTDGPATANADSESVNLGTEFYVTAQAWLTHLHYYRGTTTPNPDNARVYRVDTESAGTVVAELTPTSSGTGWQTHALATPVELTPNQRYRVVYHFPFLGAGIPMYTATGSYWAGAGGGASGITNGILVAPNEAGATGADQGSFVYGAVAFPINSFQAGNYWTDITVTDVNPLVGVPIFRRPLAGGALLQI